MVYHIYRGDVHELSRKKPFRDGECVALVQELTSVGHTSRWRPGPRVVDLKYLNPGAVIANFVFDSKGVGRFPNRHGYHAALFVKFGGRGIFVRDQFRGRKPEDLVLRREIVSRGKSRADGNVYRDADNADQFYVVVNE